jgi:ribosome-binding factor A
MESRRQLKVSSVIQEAFTDILTREGRSLYGNAFVTLTKVKLTSDLGLARFYLSIYKAEDPEEVIAKFNERRLEIKRKLGEKLRHQLRVIPEIEFFRDETLEYAFHMEEVFKKIKEDDDNLKQQVADQEKEATKEKKPAAAKKKAAAPKKAAAKKTPE